MRNPYVGDGEYAFHGPEEITAQTEAYQKKAEKELAEDEAIAENADV